MGTKYVTEAISGFDSSPPSDDGAETEANKVKYSTTKEKLADPIKTQVENIDTKLLLMADVDPESKTSTYTTVASDHQKTMECDGTFTLTLLAVSSAPAGYTVIVKNIGTGVITVDATGTETIDGSTSTVSLIAQEVISVQLNQTETGYSSLTPSGTINGRNIATDGTKLDAIEENADVTDTTNVTLAGALMDSEVDADIKTLELPASTTISVFGASLIDDASAPDARTTLGAAASGANTDITSLQSGCTAITQTANDNSTKLATTAYADVAALGSSSSLGSIGSYAMLQHATSNTVITAGTNYAGSSLRYSGAVRLTDGSLNTGGTSGTPSGTWKAMGYAAASIGSNGMTLFLRVS